MLCSYFLRIKTFPPGKKREVHKTKELSPTFKFEKAETSTLYSPPLLPAAQGKVELSSKAAFKSYPSGWGGLFSDAAALEPYKLHAINTLVHHARLECSDTIGTMSGASRHLFISLLEKSYSSLGQQSPLAILRKLQVRWRGQPW